MFPANEKRGDAAHSKRFARFEAPAAVPREAFGVRRIPPLSDLDRFSPRRKAPEYGALQTLRVDGCWSSNPEGIVPSSPGLRVRELPWGNVRQFLATPKGLWLVRLATDVWHRIGVIAEKSRLVW